MLNKEERSLVSAIQVLAFYFRVKPKGRVRWNKTQRKINYCGVRFYTNPEDPSLSRMSYKSEISTSEPFPPSLVKIEVDSAPGDSASMSFSDALFGTSNGPDGAHPSRIFVNISPSSRNSVAHIARPYNSRVRLPGPQRPNFRGLRAGARAVWRALRTSYLVSELVNLICIRFRVQFALASIGRILARPHARHRLSNPCLPTDTRGQRSACPRAV